MRQSSLDHDVIDILCKPASFASCRRKRVIDTFLPFIYEVNDLSKGVFLDKTFLVPH